MGQEKAKALKNDADISKERTASRDAHLELVYSKAKQVLEDIAAITHLTVYQLLKNEEKEVAIKVSEMLEAFGYQLQKTSLNLIHSTENDTINELEFLRLAVKSNEFLEFEGLKEFKENVSHDCASILRNTDSIGRVVAELIDAAYSYSSIYGKDKLERKLIEEGEKEPREHMLDVAHYLRDMSSEIGSCVYEIINNLPEIDY